MGGCGGGGDVSVDEVDGDVFLGRDVNRRSLSFEEGLNPQNVLTRQLRRGFGVDDFVEQRPRRMELRLRGVLLMFLLMLLYRLGLVSLRLML